MKTYSERLQSAVQAKGTPALVGLRQALDPRGDVEDPIGTGATSYQRVAELLRRRLAQRLKEQQP